MNRTLVLAMLVTAVLIVLPMLWIPAQYGMLVVSPLPTGASPEYRERYESLGSGRWVPSSDPGALRWGPIWEVPPVGESGNDHFIVHVDEPTIFAQQRYRVVWGYVALEQILALLIGGGLIVLSLQRRRRRRALPLP